jgi:hypothetical protein
VDSSSQPSSQVSITNHAVERYRERIKPALSFAVARGELERLLAECDATPRAEPPRGIIRGVDDPLYLELSPGIWLVLMPGRDGLAGVTIIFEGILSDRERERRRGVRGARRLRQRKGTDGRSRRDHIHKLIAVRGVEESERHDDGS